MLLTIAWAILSTILETVLLQSTSPNLCQEYILYCNTQNKKMLSKEGILS